MPRASYAFCGVPLLPRRGCAVARAPAPRRPRALRAPRACAAGGGGYDDFARLLGDGDTSAGRAVQRRIEEGAAPPERVVDPHAYKAFDEMLERSGGGGRKPKGGKRYERAVPGVVAAPAEGGGGGGGGGGERGASGAAAGAAPQAGKMSKAEVDEGYAFMDEVFAPQRPKEGAAAAPVPPPALSVPPPRLAQKPARGGDVPAAWLDGAVPTTPDPTRTRTADLDAPAAAARRPADTAPLTQEEVDAGYDAMRDFFADDSGAEGADGDGNAAAPTPVPAAAAEPTPLAQGPPQLKKPLLRRVTEDPSTWRENWAGVPDPTRTMTASLDDLPSTRPAASTVSPLLEKPAAPEVPAVNVEPAGVMPAPPAAAAPAPPPPPLRRPATPRPPAVEAHAAETVGARPADAVVAPSPELTGKPAPPRPDRAAAAAASASEVQAAGGWSRREARLPPLNLERPKIVSRPPRAPRRQLAIDHDAATVAAASAMAQAAAPAVAGTADAAAVAEE